MFKVFLLIILLFSTVVGCTVAVPNVTSLSKVLSFSSKSISPFEQENLGDAIFFSGYCLPGVVSFEYRFNSFSMWTQIPSTAPTPGPGEYLVGTHPYDLDCSDGEYDFYIFHSSILDNFDLNGQTPQAGDPVSLELRAQGTVDLPTILYTRPAPSSFQIYFDDYNFRGYTETGRPQRFLVNLIDAIGRHAMVPNGSSVSITSTLISSGGTSLPAGEIYDSTCTSLATNAEKTFNPGDDELILCYMATGVTANHVINIQISHPGMITASAYIVIRPQNSVMSWLSGSGSGKLPNTLLKGVDYGISMGIMPLYSNYNTRYITNYQGSLEISAAESGVTFSRVGSDIDCPSTPQIGTMTCPTNSTQKNILVNVSPSYSLSSVTLTARALPQAACGSNCTIYGDSLVHQIDNNDYISNTFSIPVVDGPTTYTQPYMHLPYSSEQNIRLGECISADIALANINDIPLPVTADRTLQISSNGSIAQFYYSHDCTGTAAGSTFNLMFFTGELFKSVFFRVLENDPSLPTNGILNMTITDQTTSLSYVKPYYIKNDN